MLQPQSEGASEPEPTATAIGSEMLLEARQLARRWCAYEAEAVGEELFLKR